MSIRLRGPGIGRRRLRWDAGFGAGAEVAPTDGRPGDPGGEASRRRINDVPEAGRVRGHGRGRVRRMLVAGRLRVHERAAFGQRAFGQQLCVRASER
jgi:hypothetical protein